MKKFNGKWDWENGEDLDFFVNVKLLPGYPKKYDILQITKDLVSKMEEHDPLEPEPMKGTRKPCDRHTRYILTANANARKAEIKAIRKARDRKEQTDPEYWYLIEVCEGAEKPFAKTSRIKQNKLIERQHRERREGKLICRMYA